MATIIILKIGSKLGRPMLVARADPNQFSVFPVTDTFHEDNVEYNTNCSGKRETRCNNA